MRKITLFLLVFIFGSFVYATDFNVYKLDNGQTVVINEIHTNPIVTIDTWVKTGSINETDKNNGISHFLEHLFFKGTPKHPYGDFDRILESKGAINNAATSKDFTHYYITIPSKYFDLALEMHADMLQNPQIPRAEMEKERKVVLEEISKDLNNPTNIAYNNLVEMLYINHPYKRRVIGKSEIIENITREEILDYFNKYYAPSNMITVVSGDVDSKTAIENIKNEFSKDYKNVCKNKFPQEKPLTSLLRKEAYTQTETGYMLIGYRGTKISDRDSYALDILATILGEGKSSVLYKSIKDKRQLAFSISTSNSSAKEDGILYISANFIPDNYKALENNIFLEISKLQRDGVTENQVNLAKNIIERDTYYARESASNIAQEVGYTFVTTGSVNFYKNYLDNIKKVSVSDVNRVLRKYLGENKAAISVVLPENYKETKNIQQKIATPTYNLVSENNGTKKYVLSNGSIILYTPNPSNDIVAITIVSNGGDYMEKIAGTGKLTTALMTKGTKNYSKTELSEIMEDNGIKIIPTSATEGVSVSVLTTKSELDKTFDLLNEIVNNASFDDAEIGKIKKDMLNNIRKNRDLPVRRAVEEYNTLIYQGSIYSNSTKIIEKTIPSVSREDILDFYNKIFAPKDLIISINGNIDSEYVFSKLGEIFNKNIAEKFDCKKNSVPKITSPRISEYVNKTTQTDWIFLGWQTEGFKNPKDYATLSVIDSLLGSGMSSRLFIDLREQEGLAYQLGTSYSPHTPCGSFVIYIGTNPKTYEHSLKKLFEEVKRLKTEYVGAEELQNAKDKLLGQYVISQETNMEKAATIAGFEASGLGYDFEKKFIDLINSVTEIDIINAANKYFNNNYVLSVVKNN